MKSDEGYSAKYDAFYDLATLQWINTACHDPRCEYCSNRPATADGLSNDIAMLTLMPTLDEVLH